MGSLWVFVAVFEPFKDARTDTLLPKLLYILMNFIGMGMGLYKVLGCLKFVSEYDDVNFSCLIL